MLAAFTGAPVQVIRMDTSARDALGRVSPVEASRETYIALLEQRGTSEDEAYTVNTWHGYFPIHADVQAADRLQDKYGRLFEVVGEPAYNRIPSFPGADHIEVRLKYVGRV